MYPTLFRRKEQTWKRLRVGPRTDDDIYQRILSRSAIYHRNDLNQRTMNASWALLLLRLASICSDSQFGGWNGADQTLIRSVCVVGTIAYGNFYFRC